jgi:hypothetical protein
MEEKIKFPQYHDWWFDNALEFLGHLLEELNINVYWNDGITFNALDKDQVKQLVEMIEGLTEYKLTYKKINAEGTHDIKKRIYLPAIHKGKYVNFLGKKLEIKKEICSYLLCPQQITEENICDICSENYRDEYEISQVSQSTYPVVTGSLKSQCGIRKMEAEYHACPRCSFLGSIAWLDDIPFACNNDLLSNYILFPKIDDILMLHRFKNMLRASLTQSRSSNVIHGFYTTKQGKEQEKYAMDQFSLLLSLFEQIKKNTKRINNRDGILCDEWVSLKICGIDAKYQTKYTYLENIKIPNIQNLERILNNLNSPYSNLIDKSFTKQLVSGKIDNNLSHENKYLMSKGIIMDDFKVFSQAFRVRQSCIITGISKDMLHQLMYSWRCKDATV